MATIVANITLPNGGELPKDITVNTDFFTIINMFDNTIKDDDKKIYKIEINDMYIYPLDTTVGTVNWFTSGVKIKFEDIRITLKNKIEVLLDLKKSDVMNIDKLKLEINEIITKYINDNIFYKVKLSA